MRTDHRRTRGTTAAVVVLGAALALSACSSSSKGGATSTPPTTPGSSSTSPPATTSSTASTASTTSSSTTASASLAGVCPSTVVVQQDWEPEAEHSGVYALVGPGYSVDTSKKRVTGEMTLDGKDLGVKIEVRAGGAAIGFQNVAAQMYIDKSITLGAVSTDGAIGSSGAQPVIAVVAQLNKSPQMLMWDPASHPSWKGIADMGPANATVVVAKAVDFADLLLAKGLLSKSQLDFGYTGAPARFVSSPTVVQQGFATAEPYIYSHEIKQWDKPVKYQLLSDVGYDVYAEPLSIRAGDLSSLTPCLTKLVPILQQAQIDYVKNPDSTNQLITDLVTKYNDGWTYSTGVATYAAATMLKLKIVADDSSGSFGSMDMARVQKTIDFFSPLLAKDGQSVKSGLKAADIATDKFIDTSIKLGS